MMSEKKLFYLLKFIISIVLFCGAVYFENAQQQRLFLLILIFVVFLSDGFVRFLIKPEKLYFYLTFFMDIALIFLLEQNSRLLINYFFHSFYIIILLEAALSLNLKRGILIGAAAVLVSLIKYGYLIYYKFNLANISQMAFFLLVNVLILVIAGFAQHNREERQRKDVLYRELLDAHKQLKQYTDEVNRLSVVEERNRIARDIHDTIGHNMTALIMQLQMAEHLHKEDPSRVEELLESAVGTAKDSLSGIREVVETLRGEEAFRYSDDAIRLLAAEFSEKTGAAIHLDIIGGNGEKIWLEKRNPSAGMTLYRIVQEALTNAVRHGKATEISVTIVYDPKEIRFHILDNGIGTGEFKEGFGLKGIRERVEAFGGEVTIESGQGFSVRGTFYLEDKKMIKILLVDDQEILVEGLKLILGKEEDLVICGSANNGKSAYEACQWSSPDVVLMDIKMPGGNGVDATAMIKKDFPQIKILVLTTFNDDDYIYEALKHGASGYLLKDTSPSEIAAAIRTVYNGGALIQSEVAVKVLDQFSELAKGKKEKKSDPRAGQLTEREIDICRLIAEGKNNHEISNELYLSEGTVKNHITRILIKLELRDRTQLAVFTIKNDL